MKTQEESSWAGLSFHSQNFVNVADWFTFELSWWLRFFQKLCAAMEGQTKNTHMFKPWKTTRQHVPLTWNLVSSWYIFVTNLPFWKVNYTCTALVFINKGHKNNFWAGLLDYVIARRYRKVRRENLHERKWFCVVGHLWGHNPSNSSHFSKHILGLFIH